MKKKDRHQKVIDEISINRKVSCSALSEKLKVSEDTIRRDIKELHDKGLITKIHGGATSNVQKLYHYNEDIIYNRENKIRIAQKAISLIQDNMVIIISGGTTNLMLAKLLPKHLKLTVYTYSLPLAMQLTEHPLVETIFIGGKIYRNSMVTIGIDVIQFLSNIRANICFMGVSGLDIETGITDEGYEVSLIKKAMIKASEHIVYLTTSNKLNIRQGYDVCSLKEIDTVVTDLDLNDSKLNPYISAGVHLL
ncbi:DeoR/GlpR family DNA-binding transcription regulator [Formosa algae]|uniref:DeoR/GlpR family transcriptional regulator of sugar metabolism n=1 Tax=Formosa algae TaxID=225843 RepID=A0A9X0YP09_9FLAO|nr:DeoR/GlpR family DNA-binding transcription regulator [Formosa algae]MBP1840383.1 DeoR/GlpR family transcriptional regulator of sugar metabolism [Formosa algae]MDQ0336875.1 DeoR/GlpR family transcriptional regulator of sugar metabolism [Formosa algae]OEI79550.1 DeoR family transcriptional regulator [Formosa algae]PNW28119.1 DeoR family transcriptional regulator [Formosa algae]